MDLPDLLEPGRITCHCSIASKKRTLQTVAELLGQAVRERLDAETAALSAPDTDGQPNGKRPERRNEESTAAAGSGGREHVGEPGRDGKPVARKERRRRDRHGDDQADGPEALSDMDILDALTARERLGSTGLGHGVALPHSRVARIEQPIAALITLSDGVDFEAQDDQPVDLVMGLLVPENCNNEHLEILAKLARRFSDAELRDRLRDFDSATDLYAYLQTLPVPGTPE